MFEQAFNNIDQALRNEAGCQSELDYTEQTSWLLFLKYLDDLEQDRADLLPCLASRMPGSLTRTTAGRPGLPPRVTMARLTTTPP